jgi:hypothetical protein
MRKIFKRISITFILILTALSLFVSNGRIWAATYVVPDHYPVIQDAVNACECGDSVLVRGGSTYYENLVIQGKNIFLIGLDDWTATIDGNEQGTTIQVVDCPGYTLIKGFCVTGCKESFMFWTYAGISAQNSNVVIRGNYIHHNMSQGIYCMNSENSEKEIWIEGNVIQANNGSGLCLTSDYYGIVNYNHIFGNIGNGISAKQDEPDDPGAEIFNNFILDNEGKGISVNYFFFPQPIFYQGLYSINYNTICGNLLDGIEITRSTARLHGNIIIENDGYGISCIYQQEDHYRPGTNYNDVWNNSRGSYSGYEPYLIPFTNISSDPLFVSIGGMDFFLSQSGAGQPVTSPCVDASNENVFEIFGMYTTRTDFKRDQGNADIGAHYGIPIFKKINRMSHAVK